ncbi:MAG: aminotransferase class I/II-fold pyridoxal phosphate-dependent enzyme [Pseudomonadota bacterium]
MQLNPIWQGLPSYPFPRLRALLDGSAPDHNDPIDLTLGAPKQPPPDFVRPIIAEATLDFGKYPPIAGTPALKVAIADWLRLRYRAHVAERAILPLVGTREGLYMLAQLAVRPGRDHVLLPNPYYPAYSASALAMTAKPVYMTCDASTGFLPDLGALSTATLERTALMFLCSPSNPQGAAATKGYLSNAISLARKHGFLLAVDECYAEIWTHEPPCGALEAAGDDHANLVVFHSLSKRSNVPGMRSGFIAGDQRVIAAFEKLRSYGGPTMPLPLQAASAALWSDQTHVDAARALYEAKFALAEDALGITRPAGGFFLWLPVENDEKTALALWKEHGVKVLPGRYLASDSEKGQNPGENHIRVALVEGVSRTKAALDRLAPALQ